MCLLRGKIHAATEVAVSYKIFYHGTMPQLHSPVLCMLCRCAFLWWRRHQSPFEKGLPRKELASQCQLAALPKEFVFKAFVTLVGIITVLVKIGRRIVKERLHFLPLLS